jgi:pimeloyl-ACP methyl ester carboxylesterase
MSFCPILQQTSFVLFYVVTFNFLMMGCTTPSLQFNQQAEDLGFTEKVYQGANFFHKVYGNRKPVDKFLHVYLGSDGTPWENPEQIASDPTPRNPVMLRLMALDSAASVYIGRPCYHGFSHSPICNPLLWTSGRYSKPIVKSLSSVLTQIAEEYQTNGIIIFGYSGGGALAMLLAERLSLVQGVVTVAGNIDIEAWADYHAYSPLTESINPAPRLPLRKDLFQFHIIGSRDKVVPPHLVQSAIKRQNGIKVTIIDDVDHQCCWEALWPGILRNIEQALEKKGL